jgi:uncharacterized protein DUF2834
MNTTQLGLAAVLIGFSAFSGYAVYQYGYLGLFEQGLANAATIQVFLDLMIALSLVMVWMWQDARKQGIAPLPYVILTLILGSIGPLFYLVRRFSKTPQLLTDLQAV